MPIGQMRQNRRIFVTDFETMVYRPDDEEDNEEVSGLLVYFLDEDGSKYRAFVNHAPYFFLLIEQNLNDSQRRELLGRIDAISEDRITKRQWMHHADADDLVFFTQKEFLRIEVRTPVDVPKLRDRLAVLPGAVECREADVLFHHRCAMDLGLRVGQWYDCIFQKGEIQKLVPVEDELPPPELKIVAWDIETNTPKNQDPNIRKDHITMISVVSGFHNVLLVNAEDTPDSQKINDFVLRIRSKDESHSTSWIDWVKKDDDNQQDGSEILEKYKCEVRVLENESQVLEGFLNLLESMRPDVVVDYFGGRFDIPFFVGRALELGLTRLDFSSRTSDYTTWLETGFQLHWKMNARSSEHKDLLRDIDYVSGIPFHLDAFLWVDRYSYLPKNDTGLKASSLIKLGIQGIGRDALWGVAEDPEEASAYCVSDSVLVWKFAKEIILDFVFAMGLQFPVPASELLTRRAGSLDDLLISAESFKQNIVGRKRFSQPGLGRLTNSINVTSVAYTGGLVESRRPGVWRSDLKYSLEINNERIDEIISCLPMIFKKQATNLLLSSQRGLLETQLQEITCISLSME